MLLSKINTNGGYELSVKCSVCILLQKARLSNTGIAYPQHTWLLLHWHKYKQSHMRLTEVTENAIKNY